MESTFAKIIIGVTIGVIGLTIYHHIIKPYFSAPSSPTTHNEGSNNNNTTINGDDNTTIIINESEKPRVKERLKINGRKGYLKSGIKILRGDRVLISASGSMKVGNLIGNSTPKGLTAGILGISLESYNVVSYYNHASLMFRLGEEEDWEFCGSKYNFTAEKGGYLIFAINDNQLHDNKGFYSIKVEIY